MRKIGYADIASCHNTLTFKKSNSINSIPKFETYSSFTKCTLLKGKKTNHKSLSILTIGTKKKQKKTESETAQI